MKGHQCTGCGLYFSGLSAFDKHRVGSYGEVIQDKNKITIGYTPHTRHCLNASEMLAAGLILKNDVWGFPADEKAQAYFEKLKAKG